MPLKVFGQNIEIKDIVSDLISDIFVVWGFDKLKGRSNRGGSENPPKDYVQKPKEPPKLPTLLIDLEKEQRKEVSEWLKGLNNHDKRKMELLANDTLLKFLKLEREERNEVLSAFNATPIEAIRGALKKFEQLGPAMPKTTEEIRKMGEWGRAADPAESEFVIRTKSYLEHLVADIRNCLSKRE